MSFSSTVFPFTNTFMHLLNNWIEILFSGLSWHFALVKFFWCFSIFSFNWIFVYGESYVAINGSFKCFKIILRLKGNQLYRFGGKKLRLRHVVWFSEVWWIVLEIYFTKFYILRCLWEFFWIILYEHSKINH